MKLCSSAEMHWPMNDVLQMQEKMFVCNRCQQLLHHHDFHAKMQKSYFPINHFATIISGITRLSVAYIFTTISPTLQVFSPLICYTNHVFLQQTDPIFK